MRDKHNRIFAHPEMIHKVRHRGKYFQMEGYHMCEPSPQRTPVLFQAGASPVGRTFAAQHAECVFISGLNRPMVAGIVADLRKRALACGRDPESLTTFAGLSVVAAKTDAEAQAKVADYHRHVSLEGALSLFGGYMEGFTKADPSHRWTLREAAEYLGVGGYSPLVAGSPQTVAGELIAWMEETGIDGFNVKYIVGPGDLAAFVDLVVPELQRRGVYKTRYEEGTFREKLYGRGQAHLPGNHPAASYRIGGANFAGIPKQSQTPAAAD